MELLLIPVFANANLSENTVLGVQALWVHRSEFNSKMHKLQFLHYVTSWQISVKYSILLKFKFFVDTQVARDRLAKHH